MQSPPSAPHYGATVGTSRSEASGRGVAERARLWYQHARSRRIVGPFLRAGILVVGLALTVLGLVLVPLPGPGWAIVFLGLATMSLEFPPARRVLVFARAAVHGWTEWLRRQPAWVRLLTAAVMAAFVLAAGWLAFRLSGTLLS